MENNAPGAKRLLAEKHLDIEAECRFRHVKNETGKFVFHCHEYYEIFLIIKGKALHQVNGKTDIVEPGTLIFIRKAVAQGEEYFRLKIFGKSLCLV